jgi:hypothetical protein
MLPVITAGGSGAIPVQISSPTLGSFELQVFTYPVSFDSYATLQAAAAGTFQNPQTEQMSGALDATFGVPVDAAGSSVGGGGRSVRQPERQQGGRLPPGYDEPCIGFGGYQ